MKKYKKTDLTSYTLGITLTIELLLTKPGVVEKIYYHPDINQNETFQKIETLAKNKFIPLEENVKIFNLLSAKENCFIIGQFIKYDEPIQANENHLVLVHPSNMGNLGTIIRTMVGFKIHNLVIIKPAVDVFDPKTIRASMGSFFHINIVFLDSFFEYSSQYKTHHIYPFMLQANIKLGEIAIQKPYALVFGNEATGLDSTYLTIGTPLLIHHSNQIDSLNLPIAVSIALYESTRNTL